MRLEQRAFPANVDSLRVAREWADALLSSTEIPDEVGAQAVLILNELASQTLSRLVPEKAEGARMWLYVRTSATTVGLGASCEAHRLAGGPLPQEDPRLRGYRHTLLEAFTDDYGTSSTEVLHTRWADIRWRHHPNRSAPATLPRRSGGTLTPRRIPDRDTSGQGTEGGAGPDSGAAEASPGRAGTGGAAGARLAAVRPKLAPPSGGASMN